MPERLDRVQITTSGGAVVIPWATRDQILERLRQRRDALPIIRAFEAVGATRPVELDTNGKALLIEALGSWIDRLGEGEAPAGLAELRVALLDDLDAAGYWRE
jgi:hypothetical protein